METQARLLGFSTISVMAITPALMATRAINASVLLVFSPYGKFYIGHLGPKHNIISPVLLHDLACSTGVSVCLVLCSAMPRERGKPRRGPTYYSRFGRHNRPGPASRALIPGGDHPGSSGQNWFEQAQPEPLLSNTEGLHGIHNSPGHASRALIPGGDHPGSSGQNWFEQAQPEPRPPSTEGLHGGCPVEEEIPPNWEEIFPFLPSTALEHRLATCTTIPFRSQLRRAALWKKKSHLWRITRDKIQPPPWTRTLSRILLLQMTRCCYHGR
jgi:hypothetical protein